MEERLFEIDSEGWWVALKARERTLCVGGGSLARRDMGGKAQGVASYS